MDGVGVLDTIANIATTDNREQSDIRVYCDDDKDKGEGGRWEVFQDAPAVPDYLKNQKKPPEEQMYWDAANEILRVAGSKGVHDDLGGGRYAMAESYRIKKDEDKSGQNRERETMTVCDCGLTF